jgi:peptidoglycan/xylan/chitin deacetylase (PgdA/CDA1 family)
MLMLPRCLHLTFHGLGATPASVRDEARRFWLPVDILERTLALAPRLEASNGIEIRFTFDDGNVSDHDLALPLLLAHRRAASFFVCAGRIGQPGHLSPAQLRALVHSGMVVGCHGYDHLNWREVDDRQLIHELRDARRQIAVAAGAAVDIASAPFGAIDQRVVRAVAAAGYKALFASSGGFATADSGLIPRNTLRAGFEPERDLARMIGRGQRAWSGLHDAARRARYRFF